MIDFKPSQVELVVPPLVGTMGSAEIEQAASLIVRTCQVLGDRWQAVTFAQIANAMGIELVNRTQYSALLSNPYFRPNVWRAVDGGFVRWTAEPGKGPAELTRDGLEKIRRWVRR